MKKITIALATLILIVFSAGLLISQAKATGQETCPDGDGWVKVDDLSDYSFTYVPDGDYIITDNCYKHATYVHFGTGDTVEADEHCSWEWVGWQLKYKCKTHELSHASFKLEKVEEEPEVCEDEQATNYQQEGECQYPEEEECIPYESAWVLSENEEYCEEEEEPEQPEQPREPGQKGTPPTFQGSTTEAPGVCGINDIGNVANIYVKTTGNAGELEVQWSLPENADKVHIIYGLEQKAEHALLNTPNDGNEVIRDLTSGRHYWFAVAGVRDCGVGNYSNWYDPIVP